ncbi:MAG TPA: hypothetical protein VFA51_09125 [Candidatus Udaeobacter sp.]|nr:hypothetical protein [Candidatus Udaeobacter sp.]
MSVISWISNLLAGVLSTTILLSEWWAIISVPIAIVGASRRRCPWYAPFLYFGGVLVCAVLFHTSLWINNRLSVGDKLSATLFWTGVLITFVGGVKPFVSGIRDTWQRTNAILPGPPAASTIFSCPNCAQRLRVPSRRGRVRTTARHAEALSNNPHKG